MANRIYGYIRVSTREQNIERQMLSLLEAGIHKKDIYVDKQSGKNFQRPAYTKMMRRVREGDLIVVKSIDRLGRNYQEIMEQWRVITKEKGADICIQDMPLLDTTKTKDLLGTSLSILHALLLSTTVTPCSAAMGAYFSLMLPPAEKRAMSMSLSKECSFNSSTT